MSEWEYDPSRKYVGLLAIAHRMGKKDPQTIRNWEARLGFPLFMNPSIVLQGWPRYYTTEDAIVSWEYGLREGYKRKRGEAYDPSTPCPLCRRVGAMYLSSTAPLKNVVIKWVKKNYLALYESHPTVAEVCLMGGISFDAEKKQLVRTYASHTDQQPSQDSLALL